MKKLSQFLFLAVSSIALASCVEDDVSYYDSSDVSDGYYSSSDSPRYNANSPHFRGNGSGYHDSSAIPSPQPTLPAPTGGYHDSSATPSPQPTPPVPIGGYQDSSATPAAPAITAPATPAAASGYSSSDDHASVRSPAKQSSGDPNEIKQKPDETVAPVTTPQTSVPSTAPNSDTGGYSSSN